MLTTNPHVLKVKIKQPLYRPWGFQKVEAPRFQDNRHMKATMWPALCAGRLYTHKIFLVIISVRDRKENFQ
jgi:hypothetical protein